MVIAVGVFSTVFANHARLAKLPLRAILKDDLGVPQETMAAFFALAGLASYLKPLAGALSDHVPLFGTRRRHYLLVSAFAGATIWAVAAFVPPTHDCLLVTMIALNGALVLGNSALGGLIVDGGRANGATGRLSALKLTVTNGATLLAGPLGGWLAGRAFGFTCAIGVALLLALGGCVLALARAEPQRPVAPARAPEVARALLRQLRSREFTAAALLYVAFHVAPGFGTPLYYQKNALSLSDQDIGWLGALNCLGGILGALCYPALCRRLNLGSLLVGGILTYAGCMLLYLAYRSWEAALVLEGCSGFFCLLGILPLQHLAVRVSPAHSGAFGYALVLGLGNAAMALSDVMGTQLMARLDLGLPSMIGIAAAASAATVVLVAMLPAELLRERER
ncbi:MFS transporter [Nannocystis pusilla]|uniref:MFS transporter n=1 Tax=Nannocystis pusilla TaxID=889268 RepID=UPI003B7CB3C5